jgi:acyl carrier protein
VIADPERRKPVPPGAEGEVWIRGPSVTTGYWPPGASHASAGDGELFAKLDGVRYLRTGDRGYLADGELVITGRLKDVIIARGVNYHAADLEDAAVAGDPRLRQVAAAFAADGDHPDSAVVIVVEARSGAAGAAQLVPEIRARVAARCGLVPDEIVVAPPGSIPRTSSGKVQRGLCRAHFAAGRFGRPRTQVTAVGAPTADGRPASGTRATTAASGAGGAEPAGASADLTTTAGLTAAAGLTELLRGVFAASCDVPDCGAHTTLFDLGGDSLRAAEIAAVLQNVLGVRVTASLVLETPTPCRLAEQLARTWLEQNGNGGTLVQRLTNLADLSAGQEDEG